MNKMESKNIKNVRLHSLFHIIQRSLSKKDSELSTFYSATNGNLLKKGNRNSQVISGNNCTTIFDSVNNTIDLKVNTKDRLLSPNANFKSLMIKNIQPNSGFTQFTNLAKSNKSKPCKKKVYYSNDFDNVHNTYPKLKLASNLSNVYNPYRKEVKKVQLTSHSIISPQKKNVISCGCENYYINNIKLTGNNLLNTNQSCSGPCSSHILQSEFISDVNFSNQLFENLKIEYDHFKRQMEAEITQIKQNLVDKDHEIQELVFLLENKEKYITNLQLLIYDMNKKLDADAEADTALPKDRNNIKQLIRNNRVLSGENQILKEENSKLENEIMAMKEKEVEIMKIIHSLSKLGYSVDQIKQTPGEVLHTEPDNEDTTQEGHISGISNLSKSLNSAMFIPLTIEEPRLSRKPICVPELNLKNIKSQACENAFRIENNDNIDNEYSASNINIIPNEHTETKVQEDMLCIVSQTNEEKPCDMNNINNFPKHKMKLLGTKAHYQAPLCLNDIVKNKILQAQAQAKRVGNCVKLKNENIKKF